MDRGILNFPLRKNSGDLRGAIAVHTKLEYFSNHLGGILIHDPAMLILRIFEVAIGRIGTQRLTGFTLCLEHCSDLLAGVFGIPFVDDIEEGSKIAVLLVGTVHTVIDSDETDICAGQNYLGVVYVYKAEKVDGRRVQRIKIIYNCIGEFTLLDAATNEKTA